MGRMAGHYSHVLSIVADFLSSRTTPKKTPWESIMRNVETPHLVDLVSWLFCAFLSHSIIQDWTGFPLLHWSMASFCIWLIPIFVYWFYPYAQKPRHSNPMLLGAGVLLSLLGLLGELNILKHLGLALASVGLIPWSNKQLIWLLTAVAWLPATAYLLRSFSFDLVIVLRLLIVTISALTSISVLFYDHILIWKGYDQQKK
jgi:hypothetical protein